jgi:LemA protein
MSSLPVLLAVAGLALCVWTIYAFNRLVRGRNLVKEGWSGIDVQLKRRHTLIPRLVDIVKGYAEFESAVLSEMTELRGRVEATQDLREMQAGENALSGHIKSILAVVEAYPDLKAARNFVDLQQQLCDIEDQIQMARRYYNGAVRDYNVRVESFPGLIVAGIFGFEPAGFFQIETATERRAPNLEMDE